MPAIDTVPTNSSRVDYPAEDAFAISPHATDELTFITRAIYVGTGGTLVVVMANSSTPLTFTKVPDGSIIPIRVRAVRATSTASDIVGLIQAMRINLKLGLGLGSVPRKGAGTITPPTGTTGQPIGLLLILTKAA